MKLVYQTRSGGFDSPIGDQGNCFQACVATLLQIPLEVAFDCIAVESNGHWFEDFNKWLEQYGLGCIYLETSKEKPMTSTDFLGLHIMECMSITLYQGERHAVVIKNGEVIHDPDPNAKEQGECKAVYIFVPLEAYRLVRQRA